MPTALFAAGAVIAFLYGTVIGSFLNVCIYRLPRGESLLAPPSHCPSCNTRLRPLDLFPLLSFLALRGKCRYCGARITWRYFIIEFCTGLLFVGFWWSLASTAALRAQLFSPAGMLLVVLAWVFASAMLVTFMIDLETMFVIEPVTWVAMGAGILFEIIYAGLNGKAPGFTAGSLTVPYLPAAVPGMMVGFLVFLVIDFFVRLLARKPGMGMGDAYIGAAIGAMLGPGRALLSFGMAVLLGAVVGVVILVAAAIAHRRQSPATEDDGQATEPPVDLQLKPFFISVGTVALLWFVLVYLGLVLHDALGAKNGWLPLLIGTLFATATAVALILLGGLWREPVVETANGEALPDLPSGHYMPFGPFLTASAVLIALSPPWFTSMATAVIHWWLFQNPLAS